MTVAEIEAAIKAFNKVRERDGWEGPAIVAALEAAERVRWQPIETAPKDGSDILAYAPPEETGEGWECRVVFYDQTLPYGTKFCWQAYDAGSYRDDLFTHWQPLPSPPWDR